MLGPKGFETDNQKMCLNWGEAWFFGVIWEVCVAQ